MLQPNYRRDKGVLPPYASAEGCVLEALPALAPSRRITVPAAAAQFRKVEAKGYRGPWQNETAPHMVEPAEMMTSRRYEGVVFAGPARTLKTDALVINTVVHRVTSMPRNMLIMHMTRETARKFSMEAIDKLLRTSPDVKARLGTSRRDDNLFDKRFKGGMLLSIGWPVISQVSGATYEDMLATDYDRMPEDIDGEGDLFALMLKRGETEGSLAKSMAESSPGRPILDADWQPQTPHEPPPTTGILSLYGQGTRGRLYWPCAQCEEPYEPTFAMLSYPKDAPAVEAGEQAVLVCPHCGYPTPQSVKMELLAASYWLHETADARIVHVDGKPQRIGLTRIDGNVRPARYASYWHFGPAARFQTWAGLVASRVEAEDVYRRTGDEQKLKTTVNIDDGNAYRPRAMGAGSLLSETFLRNRAVKLGEKHSRIVPASTRFTTVQIDVQATKFVVQTDAWGEDLERTLVDRFELFKPHDANAERALDPARYLDDWNAIFDLCERLYEVEGTGYNLKPAFIVVDSGGAPGVTANAYKFWRRARAKGLGERIMLVRGNHVKTGLPENQRRAYIAYPERSTENGKKKQLDVPVIWVGTDALKDEISAALTRDELGENSYTVLDRVDDAVFAELAAERRTDKGWEKRPGVIRNEALDLAVYGKAVVIVKGGEKIDWASPVDWAAPMPTNAYSVLLEGAVVPEPEPEDVNPVEESRPARQGSSWLGGRRRGYLG